MSVDQTDKKLLQIIQSDFPVVQRPYEMIGRQLGISGQEVMDRISRLQQAGIIRRLGGLFDSRKIGYTGTLCALRVPEEEIDRVAQIINSYPGITHNYLRNHHYNMWFTLLAESEQHINSILNEIKEKTGLADILNLPAINIFKVRVNFNLSEVKHAD
ncbi:AsnC family transcriptional regulator [Desulfallas thermosapovorans]|uniref:siroheme decarboxylase n=1 Tax=Desulfallas thermosapovorans DSM 6562 TaxID=1121431 RepID=A0A5S4ZQV5_9FIRM|nr:AsnC family transcriptional regulator [Desulfallas thermosapovorans]TYO94996.1 transcriptional regulator, AsnC family [Desulfallas thermosapovorans DSM 6562]